MGSGGSVIYYECQCIMTTTEVKFNITLIRHANDGLAITNGLAIIQCSSNNDAVCHHCTIFFKSLFLHSVLNRKINCQI